MRKPKKTRRQYLKQYWRKNRKYLLSKRKLRYKTDKEYRRKIYVRATIDALFKKYNGKYREGNSQVSHNGLV